LTGWGLSGLTIFQSGVPCAVTDDASGTSYPEAGLAAATRGAQLTPGGSIGAGTTTGDIHSRLNGYLSLTNFTTAPVAGPAGCVADPAFACTTAFGNLGRNIYRGPFQQNWDFSLIKNFKLTERQSLRFTTDFFNIWNHVNFANPSINDV